MSGEREVRWNALWAGLRQLDGDAWDAESDRLDALWQAEYVRAFVDFALTRHGWDRENAELWADDVVADALASCRGSEDPAEVAKVDVVECELEAAP